MIEEQLCNSNTLGIFQITIWIQELFHPPESRHDRGSYSRIASCLVMIVLFHSYFSSNGEQPEQCILAHKSEQPFVGCMATLIARFMGPTWSPSGAGRTQVGPMLAPWILLSGCISQTLLLYKTWGIITNLTPWNPWRYITEMSKYHNAGIWSMDRIYYIFC